MNDERTVRELREDRIREIDFCDRELSRVIDYATKRRAELQRERSLHASLLARETESS